MARRGVIWLGVANVLAKGSQMVMTLAMARFLSPTELGRFSLAMTLLTYASLLQSMGMYDVINRTRNHLLSFAGTMATISLGLGGVLALILGVFAEQWATLMGDPGLATAVRVAALCLPLMAYAGIQTAYLTRKLDFRTRVFCDGGSAVVGTLASIILMVMGYGAPGALAGVVVTYVTLPLIAIVAGIRIVPRWKRAHAAEAWSWTKVAGPGAVLGVVMFSLDYIVIGRILGPAATGVYGLGYRFAFMPYVALAMVLAGVAFPIFAHLARERGGLDDAVMKYTGVMSGVLFGVYSVLALIAPYLVILGEDWKPAITPLRILCVYGALLSLALIPLDALRAVGRKTAFLVVQCLHFLSLLTLLIVLTAQFEITGAAVAQAICAGMAATVAFSLLARGGGVPLSAVLGRVRSPGVAAALVVAVGLGVEWARPLPTTSLTALVVTGIVGLAAYAGILHLLDRDLTAMIRRQLIRR